MSPQSLGAPDRLGQVRMRPVYRSCTMLSLQPSPLGYVPTRRPNPRAPSKVPVPPVATQKPRLLAPQFRNQATKGQVDGGAVVTGDRLVATEDQQVPHLG